jgi:hypothetical protein
MTYHASNQEFRAFAVQSKLNKNSHMTIKFASNPPIRDHDRTESPGNAHHLTTELPHLTDAPSKSDSPLLKKNQTVPSSPRSPLRRKPGENRSTHSSARAPAARAAPQRCPRRRERPALRRRPLRHSRRRNPPGPAAGTAR